MTSYIYDSNGMAAVASHAIYNNTTYRVLGWLSSMRIILKTKWISSVRTVAPKRDNNHSTGKLKKTPGRTAEKTPEKTPRKPPPGEKKAPSSGTGSGRTSSRH